MKDLQKIKEFFSKSVNEAIETPMDAIAFLNANKDEIIKLADQYKGDVSSMQKAIDAFLAPHIDGTPDFLIDKIKAAIGGAIAKRNIAADPKLSATYDKLKNVKGFVGEANEPQFKKGDKVTYLGHPGEITAVNKEMTGEITYSVAYNKGYGRTKSSNIHPKSGAIKPLKEAKTAVDMAKKRLDALGVKYEMSKTDKVRPFKVIYKPINKSDKFYDEFEDIVDLFNLKGFVKTSMNEAKKEDVVDTVTMDVPLFIRMLEYSREDAAADVDLHDVTEKAITLGKERGLLSMDDYSEIVGAAEDAPKGEVDEAELTEAYVPSNIKEFAKRRGVSSLVNKVAGWAEKVGKSITGGTAIGYGYNTLVLDMGYQSGEIRINIPDETIELYDEPVNSFPEFKSVYLDNKEEDNVLEKRIHEALDKINEELCPAGKAYIKRRQAAGEKSSAYLSGRAVKVCKGQMSGKAKKK